MNNNTTNISRLHSVATIFILLISFFTSIESFTSITTPSLPLPKPLSKKKSLTALANKEPSPDSAIGQKKKRLNREFVSIAVPAFIQLAAEPLAGLVDTAYLGRLGPEVLGGAGVAISAHYAVSKLYNDPLLRTSISLVAAQDGKSQDTDDEVVKKKNLSIAVSSALLLASAVGLIQFIVYFFLSNTIVRGMGVEDATNPMWNSALSYIKVRALGSPASTLWLVTNGVFRGLGDTKTPLQCSILFTTLNAILDPIFIFTLRFGASGAAAGTALAQYIALIPLLYLLNKRVPLDIWNQLSDLGKSLKIYLEAGVLVLARTFGKVLAYSVCAREAALLGPIAAAAYNLTFQLGFATTQICESVAIAVQTLLAREIASTTAKDDEKRESVQHLIRGSILLGGIVASTLSLTTFFQRSGIMQGLTNNVDIKQASLKIFPAVLTTQVLKGLAYPVNGIIMGGLDWKFAMIAMWIANFTCVGMIQLWKPTMTLDKIWWALAAFMGAQVLTSIVRVYSGTGAWKVLRRSHSKEGQL